MADLLFSLAGSSRKRQQVGRFNLAARFRSRGYSADAFGHLLRLLYQERAVQLGQRLQRRGRIDPAVAIGLNEGIIENLKKAQRVVAPGKNLKAAAPLVVGVFVGNCLKAVRVRYLGGSPAHPWLVKPLS